MHARPPAIPAVAIVAAFRASERSARPVASQWSSGRQWPAFDASILLLATIPSTAPVMTPVTPTTKRAPPATRWVGKLSSCMTIVGDASAPGELGAAGASPPMLGAGPGPSAPLLGGAATDGPDTGGPGELHDAGTSTRVSPGAEGTVTTCSQAPRPAAV